MVRVVNLEGYIVCILRTVTKIVISFESKGKRTPQQKSWLRLC